MTYSIFNATCESFLLTFGNRCSQNLFILVHYQRNSIILGQDKIRKCTVIIQCLKNWTQIC